MTRRTPDGRELTTLVWICEYPYRTMLEHPCTDCEGHDWTDAEILRYHSTSEQVVTH